MTPSVSRRHRRRNPIAATTPPASLPLAVRLLVRRYGLMPGMATAVAAAAGFNLDVR